ncbi:hypothetical protein VTN00DRAFT_3531 [Thermoascus crustaceus]|uniref:uncharacterized protein n=1 Tax=Thermoascus crustaceus TaxID=5088 RepID=UPI003742BC5B
MTITKLCLTLPLVLGAVSASASPYPNDMADVQIFSPLHPIVTNHRAVNPVIRRDDFNFSSDSTGCGSFEKVCGNYCIKATYTCCPDKQGGCSLDETCQLGDNGQYGCCPIGSTCTGDGGSRQDDDSDSDSDSDSGSGNGGSSSDSDSDSSGDSGVAGLRPELGVAGLLMLGTAGIVMLGGL